MALCLLGYSIDCSCLLALPKTSSTVLNTSGETECPFLLLILEEMLPTFLHLACCWLGTATRALRLLGKYSTTELNFQAH